MKKNEDKRSKKIFIFGFVALLLCGVGDWLIGYEPAGGQELIYGITRTTIAQVTALGLMRCQQDGSASVAL